MDLDDLTALLAAALYQHRWGGPDLCSCGQTFHQVEDESGQIVRQSWEVHAAAAVEKLALPYLIEAARREAALREALEEAISLPLHGGYQQQQARWRILLHDNAGAATPGATEPE